MILINKSKEKISALKIEHQFKSNSELLYPAAPDQIGSANSDARNGDFFKESENLKNRQISKNFEKKKSLQVLTSTFLEFS